MPFAFGKTESTHDFGDDNWYACDFPERMPVLDVTWFHHNCRSCRLAAQAMNPYWDRTPWQSLPECLDQHYAGRTKLDSEGHTVTTYDPPVIVAYGSI